MKRIIHAVGAALALAAALAGCGNWSFPGSTASSPPATPPDQDAAYLGKTLVNPDPAARDSSTAVDSALALSQRNVQLTEELMRVKDEKYQLEDTSRKLREQTVKLQDDLAAARKELDQANQMLIEMRQEVNGWKNNVLGFRNEIRDAQLAQMDALRKVLILLGAEVPASSGAVAPATQPAATQPAGNATALMKGYLGETP